MFEATPVSLPSRRPWLTQAVLRCVLAAGLIAAACGAQAQAAAPAASMPVLAQAAAHVGPISPTVTRRQQRQSEHAVSYYSAAWGIQDLVVRSTASGNLIRFSYRVIDPARAKPLVDKGSMPLLVGQRSHAVLQVPVMDKVGPLRQTNDMSTGKEYWMAFSNKGSLVKPGDRVNVVIGAFHADGLLVE